jgi:hypothetical protein
LPFLLGDAQSRATKDHGGTSSGYGSAVRWRRVARIQKAEESEVLIALPLRTALCLFK